MTTSTTSRTPSGMKNTTRSPVETPGSLESTSELALGATASRKTSEVSPLQTTELRADVDKPVVSE